jgi:hypothetical protein
LLHDARARALPESQHGPAQADVAGQVYRKYRAETQLTGSPEMMPAATARPAVLMVDRPPASAQALFKFLKSQMRLALPNLVLRREFVEKIGLD